ncbi:hypothetical protein [Variovorax sp. JS1663]|uniref:hypothetical protein n=1 Tax=Variovorax sp. JS1663 TaxID=1851577 RepID=UPI000B34309A|nr:hypothetical protein [Variovorax sp. JS1663]OUM01744.1 hypothetical protein A8M77_14375 [Variovorax sp. JS1663]
MPTYEFTSPDGKTYEVGAPEGATREQAFGMLQSQIDSGTAPAASDPSLVVSAGRMLNDVPRQFGLAGRYALTGPAKAAQVVKEPLRYFTDKVLPDRQVPPKSTPLGVQAEKLADTLGLPRPQTPTERVIGDASEMVAGAGGLAGLAGKGAEMVSRPVAGFLAENAPKALTTGESLLRGLAANVPAQLGGAAGAGLAGGASREAGGGPWQQLGASVLGTLAGAMMPGGAGNLLAAGRRLLAPAPTAEKLDMQLTRVLGQSGTDYSALPAAAKIALRREMADALSTGREVSPEALSRLADFRALDITPTRGMISQNPVDITREQNLAKMAANSSDGQLAGLPMLQNQNNRALIGRMNDLGAQQGDTFAAGERAIGAIAAKDAAEQARVSGLYTRAREMPGGEIPLERTGIVNGVYDALNRENKLRYLPAAIADTLNDISLGQTTVGGRTFQVPFDAKALDNLLTDIATAQRSTSDGNVRAALGIARRAIDAAPIAPIKAPVQGQPLVTEAGAAYLRGSDAEAPAFMDALHEARRAAAARFNWRESSRPVEAALGAGQPDNFVRRFVVGGSLEDAAAVAREAPAAQVKEAIVSHLKDRALNGATDEVGRFSQSAYNKALDAIGDRKLQLFFSPEEITQLHRVGRVSSLMQVQPVGSAVNNSNSGALLLGRGIDMLGKVPFLGPLTAPAAQNINITLQQRAAQNVGPGLLRPVPAPSRVQPLLLPGLAAGGALLSQ